MGNLQVFDAHNANMSPVQGTYISTLFFFDVVWLHQPLIDFC